MQPLAPDHIPFWRDGHAGFTGSGIGVDDGFPLERCKVDTGAIRGVEGYRGEAHSRQMIGTAIINRCWEGGPINRGRVSHDAPHRTLDDGPPPRPEINRRARPRGLELSSRPRKDQVKKYNRAGIITTATPVSPTLLR